MPIVERVYRDKDVHGSAGGFGRWCVKGREVADGVFWDKYDFPSITHFFS